jgi:hypothetical protein
LQLRWLITAVAAGCTPRVLLSPAIGPIWTLETASARGFQMPATMPVATLSRPLLLVALLGGALLAATLGLWAYNGTTVFFEMVRTGWLACF